MFVQMSMAVLGVGQSGFVWPSGWDNVDISVKPVVVAAVRWGRSGNGSSFAFTL